MPEIASVRDEHRVTHLNHKSARLRACRAALRPACANPPEREYRFAKIDPLIDLVAKLVEDLRREPLVLGTGKRLFDDGAVPAGLELTGSQTSSTGVIIATYRSGAEITYGSFAE